MRMFASYKKMFFRLDFYGWGLYSDCRSIIDRDIFTYFCQTCLRKGDWCIGRCLLMLTIMG